jgi:NAD(P)H-hydrate epimerase
MREAEEAAFARGISAEALMDEAGAGIAHSVRRFFSTPGRCVVFAGKGNNAGDAVVAALHLKRTGWQTSIRFAYAERECGELPRKKLAEFRGVAEQTGAHRAAPLIVLDGLLGLGSKPPLRDPVKKFAREINQLRTAQNACVFAIDLPSGLDGDTGIADKDCVVADFTLTIGAAKRGLVTDDAIDFVGRLEVVPLSALELPSADETLACPESLRGLLPRREFGAYKNQFGRIGIVAGSRGLIGAALLSAEGALRGGAGLVRVFVLKDIYSIVAAAAPAEAMIQPIESYDDLGKESVAVWAVGPGLGRSHAPQILRFIESAKQPMVVDADALNIVSDHTSVLKNCAGPRLLTPHPGEMKRLAGEQKISRAQLARKFTGEFPVTLLLKGSRTVIAENGQPLSYNPTGNPGMATGGMGDALTGVCAALIGQKLSPFNAARLGAWACGRAAELAIYNGFASEQSLLARDVIENLGRAFREVQ